MWWNPTKAYSSPFLKSSKELDVDEKKLLRQLQIKFQDSFSKGDRDLGLTHITEHAIDTGDAAPVKQPQRRVQLAFAAEERKAIEDLKAKGVIMNLQSQMAFLCHECKTV